MSWHYLPELVAGSSVGTSSDGEQSAPSSGPSFPEKPCSGDSETERFPSSQSGTTCRPSTGNPGLDWWMSSLEGFRARTSAQPDEATESTARGPGCGSTWIGSSAKYDPASRSWKTAQFSLLEGLGVFSETWPRWGSTRSMEFWERSMPGRRTSETESGLWPTIRAQDGDRGGRGDLIQAVRGNENTHFRLWQTPVADDAVDRKRGKWNSRGEPKLSAEVLMFPTPRANDGEKRGNFDLCNPRNGLPAAAKSLDPSGGQLNPDWVEWLMGWPIGWTACEPLEMDRFQQWPRWHSEPSVDGLE